MTTQDTTTNEDRELPPKLKIAVRGQVKAFHPRGKAGSRTREEYQAYITQRAFGRFDKVRKSFPEFSETEAEEFIIQYLKKGESAFVDFVNARLSFSRTMDQAMRRESDRQRDQAIEDRSSERHVFTDTLKDLAKDIKDLVQQQQQILAITRETMNSPHATTKPNGVAHGE